MISKARLGKHREKFNFERPPMLRKLNHIGPFEDVLKNFVPCPSHLLEIKQVKTPRLSRGIGNSDTNRVYAFSFPFPKALMDKKFDLIFLPFVIEGLSLPEFRELKESLMKVREKDGYIAFLFVSLPNVIPTLSHSLPLALTTHEIDEVRKFLSSLMGETHEPWDLQSVIDEFGDLAYKGFYYETLLINRENIPNSSFTNESPLIDRTHPNLIHIPVALVLVGDKKPDLMFNPV